LTGGGTGGGGGAGAEGGGDGGVGVGEPPLLQAEMSASDDIAAAQAANRVLFFTNPP
jgi:hypothetical protein